MKVEERNIEKIMKVLCVCSLSVTEQKTAYTLSLSDIVVQPALPVEKKRIE